MLEFDHLEFALGLVLGGSMMLAVGYLSMAFKK